MKEVAFNAKGPRINSHFVVLGGGISSAAIGLGFAGYVYKLLFVIRLGSITGFQNI